MSPFSMFGGHKHSVSRDIMIFVCHVILNKPLDQGVVSFYG